MCDVYHVNVPCVNNDILSQEEYGAVISKLSCDHCGIYLPEVPDIVCYGLNIGFPILKSV